MFETSISDQIFAVEDDSMVMYGFIVFLLKNVTFCKFMFLYFYDHVFYYRYNYIYLLLCIIFFYFYVFLNFLLFFNKISILYIFFEKFRFLNPFNLIR